jgi:hypothetical protein
LNQALEVAIDQLYSSLPEADLKHINAIRGELFRKRLIENEHQSGEV